MAGQVSAPAMREHPGAMADLPQESTVGDGTTNTAAMSDPIEVDLRIAAAVDHLGYALDGTISRSDGIDYAMAVLTAARRFLPA